MSNIIDRRGSTDRATGDRRRFIERNKKTVRKAVREKFSDGNVTDIGKGGTDVPVPKDDLSQPTIHHGKGGIHDRVFPGNKEFQEGDRLQKPRGGGGCGSGDGDPSDNGEGEDDFVFHLSEQEFLDILFEDLELPNLLETNQQDDATTKPKRAGYTSEGPPAKRDLVRSKKKQISRLAATTKKDGEKIENLLQEEKALLEKYSEKSAQSGQKKRDWEPRKTRIRNLDKRVSELKDTLDMQALSDDDSARIQEIEAEIESLQLKQARTPTWDPGDLQYKYHEQQPEPNTQAVMFCLMDVSASMDQETKDHAKLFYFLLHRFLQRQYDKVDIVFIRHTQEAEEVNEQQFFYGRETGGTIVSSGLEKMQKIMNDRYPSDSWNIYAAQATDGDNSQKDNKVCARLLQQIVPESRGYFYTEIVSGKRGGRQSKSDLWGTYSNIAAQYPDRFFMGRVESREDIWPVFRDFFQRHERYESRPAGSSASAFQPRP